MISLQLAAGGIYIAAMLIRTMRILRDAAWPLGFLCWPIAADQRFANVAFELVRCMRRVQTSLYIFAVV